ncbi:MAG: cysteine desulfurase [Bacteroides sp.]|nr:cysteine desulfurase [Eubacterium sp.]MCM1418690.1 cysteine desulfurase [Roseburia sp.]MCM1462718.1 cysteine desulfurase [Bacteroides sp.]
MIYLDNAATTKPCKEAVDAANAVMAENFGNASSLHRAGIGAERVLKESKKTLLDLIGAEEGELIFTSGATESNNTAILGVAEAYRHGGKRIVTTATEHPSVAVPVDKLAERGYEAIRLAPKDHDDFEEALAAAVDENTLLVSAIWVNNETGFITDPLKLYRAVKRRNPKTLVHIDAVQGFRKLPSDRLKGDLISLSAHKIHGLKGSGALYTAKGVRFTPLLYGGGQQGGLRSGTEPIELIAAFAAAAKAYPDSTARYAALAQALRSLLLPLGGITFNSEHNAPNILNFSVAGVRSEIMLHILEEREIYVSSGSACSRGKKSRVLAAFGVGDENADTAVRVSFCPATTEDDLRALADGVRAGIERIRR